MPSLRVAESSLTTEDWFLGLPSFSPIYTHTQTHPQEVETDLKRQPDGADCSGDLETERWRVCVCMCVHVCESVSFIRHQ